VVNATSGKAVLRVQEGVKRPVKNEPNHKFIDGTSGRGWGGLEGGEGGRGWGVGGGGGEWGG